MNVFQDANETDLNIKLFSGSLKSRTSALGCLLYSLVARRTFVMTARALINFSSMAAP